jgi:predicted acetyltransferase
MLVTHPDFRRSGAATMLCNWGQDEAMKRGWMLTVMASPMGKALYENLGYELVGSVTVHVDGEDESVVVSVMEKKL